MQEVAYSFKDFQLSGDVKSKVDPAYGKKICEYIDGTIGGTNGYMWLRNARFKFNRDLANGVVDMKRYMDMFDFKGEVNYMNINWSAPKICNTLVSRLVGRWNTLNERIQITAIDPISSKKKREREDEAEFNLEEKDKITQLQGASGIPVVSQDSFMPEDKDELDAWKTEFNRLPEEIGYELGVNTIFETNGWYDVLKEQVLHDSAEVGFIGSCVKMCKDGAILVRRVEPENAIYSWSAFNDFRDTSWRGEIISMKISEIRSDYGQENGGKLTEEEIFKIAQTSKNWQLHDKITWTADWTVAFLRPYDEWNVDVCKFELKSFDSDTYLVTKTKEYNNTIVRQNPKSSKVSDNQELVKSDKWNIYEGCYVRGCKTLLHWGIKKNMIRPQDPKEIGNAEFSYSFYMYQNRNMRNIAIPEKAEAAIDQMILATLKMQQLIAKMKPAGAAIDVDALQELDLGLADTTKPLEVQKIYDQTGLLYYRGRDAEGNRIPLPITELANSGFMQQMQGLIQTYQINHERLRTETGINEFSEGQSVKPRTGVGVVESQTQISYNATDYMYIAYSRLTEETAKKVGCLLNASVTHGAEAYRHLVKEDEVKNRDFSTKVKLLPTEDEINKLEAMLNNAIASTPDLIIYIDPFKILRIAKENIKLAELYFRQSMKRMLKSKSEQASKNAQENAQIQMESAKAKAEGDKELKNIENSSKERQIIVQGAFDLLKTGLPLPAEVSAVLTGIIKNVGMPLAMENMQMEQGIQQQIQQQQAVDQGQMAPQEMVA